MCKKGDKAIRIFVWGSWYSRKKPHFVKWDDVCRSKDEGSLGLRQATLVNEALCEKLAWYIISRPDDFWVRVVMSKYRWQDFSSGNGITHYKNSPSSTWWAICSIWKHVERGINWIVGMVERLNFG